MTDPGSGKTKARICRVTLFCMVPCIFLSSCSWLPGLSIDSRFADKIWIIDKPLPQGFSLETALEMDHDHPGVSITYARYLNKNGLHIWVERLQAKESSNFKMEHDSCRRQMPLLDSKDAINVSRGTLVVAGHNLAYVTGKYQFLGKGKKRDEFDGEFEPTRNVYITVKCCNPDWQGLPDIDAISSFLSHVKSINI